MTRHYLYRALILLAVLLSACAPGTATAPPVPPQAVEPSATAVLAPAGDTIPAVDGTVAATVEQQPATQPAEALPVATSRGPDLHATDPTTVSLASGGLQFVEFFRFT